ncbi:MAG: diguanylate cyclase domain-containing protein [Solirubrobacteraceae bacterium]|jgi:diguanylate cyclase (GGDEF)-like protein/PAS domain S-box-containing protein
MSIEPNVDSDRVAVSAEDAAVAALRELPEARILVFDRELRFILSAGQTLVRGAGNDPAVCREGAPVREAFPSSLWKLIEPLCRSALDGETRSREIYSADDSRSLMVNVGPLGLRDAPDRTGQPSGIAGGVAVILDITARRAADEIARSSHDHFEQVFERAPIGMGLMDLDGRWTLVNRALCEITGYTTEELIGRRFADITHPEDVHNDAAQHAQLLAGAVPAFQAEKRYFNAAGEVVSAILSISLVRDAQSAPVHFIAQLQDISERKRLEEHLRHLADHDPLTGLRNRRLFEHDLKLQVARSQRYGERAAVMVVDLNAFKQINDRYGHKVGDDALKAVATALTRRLRETDLVARMGGDEFAVLLPHADDEGTAIVADGLVRVIAACSIDAGDTVVHPSGSVGMAMIDRWTISAERVLVAADRAMYAAKRAPAPNTSV